MRDVIPESRLASYGDFEYGEGESPAAKEQPEERNDGVQVEGAEDGREKPPASNGEAGSPALREPWMLDEVEEYVDRVVADAHRRRRQPRKSLVRVIYLVIRSSGGRRGGARRAKLGKLRLENDFWKELGVNLLMGIEYRRVIWVAFGSRFVRGAYFVSIIYYSILLQQQLRVKKVFNLRSFCARGW